jgi:hypothetical protein
LRSTHARSCPRGEAGGALAHLEVGLADPGHAARDRAGIEVRGRQQFLPGPQGLVRRRGATEAAPCLGWDL